MTFEVQGHRGCRGLRPENTLPGFQTAFDLGAASIETDLQRTADGVLVLYHDFRLSEALCRRLDPGVPDLAGRPAIRELALAQLRGYVADGNPDRGRFPAQSANGANGHAWRIPTLTELFELAQRSQRLLLDLEIKCRPFRDDGESIADQVVAEIRAAEMVGRCRVRSFDHRVVRRVLELEPLLEGGVLIAGTTPGDPVALARWAGARVYCPDFEFLTRDQVRACREAGLRVIPWTVNEPADLARLLDWGVDGITTDYPDRLAEMWAARRLGH